MVFGADMEGTEWAQGRLAEGDGPMTPFSISREKATEIALFCKVAKANESALSLKEIIQLTSLDLSEEGLARAWHSAPALSKYEIGDYGVVYEKEECQAERQASSVEQNERKQRANANIEYARKFAELIGGIHNRKAQVISISGSTSYFSVSRQDDLDIFCIARRGSMWSILCKSLLLARALKVSDDKSPQLCLSYIMDEEYALREFTRPQDGLFARDAISTLVIHGADFYNSLLAKSDWMRAYFPAMYAAKIGGGDRDTQEFQSRHSQDLVTPARVRPRERILNLFLYATAGTYIRMKSYLLNRRFAKKRQKSRAFRLRIGPDRCIYESLNYLELRKMYSKLEKRVTS